ncbi:hypothetical protein BGZ76_011477 [Entomortierella beljakovae]|nr:hypothetical protein BGZ76_011477 [Entomortierella beljakovae]
MKEHEPPLVMVQYKWKPHKTVPENPDKAASANLNTKKAKKKAKVTPIDEMDKTQLMRVIQGEHPLRTLNVGSAKANAKEAIGSDLENRSSPDVTTMPQRGLFTWVQGCK